LSLDAEKGAARKENNEWNKVTNYQRVEPALTTGDKF
jgi:hypothetical protein